MTNCPICFDNINEKQNYLVTDCKHKFHFSCIIKNIDCNFFSRGLNCPICRASLLPDRVSSTVMPSRVTGGGPVPRVPPRPPVPIIIRPMQNRNIIRNNLTNILNQIDNMHNRLQNRVQNRRIHAGGIVRSQNTSRSIALKKIDKLTYSQLKNELKKRSLSTRGYKRETLEKRL